MHFSSVSLAAPAKINLLLLVNGRRADGYHLIITLLQKISLSDRLYVEVRPGRAAVELNCPGSDLPTDSRNLAFRAAELFLEATCLDLHVRMELTKGIPIGGGLGGGSSDAAAVLRGLSTLAGKPLSAIRLRELAARLGADVPFFLLDASAAVGQGIGTELKVLVVPASWYLLVWPSFGITTRWVYGNFVLTSQNHDTTFDAEQALRTAMWRNDLEQVVVPRYPEIGRIKAALKTHGARAASMSGSGSTVFGAFFSQEGAQEAAIRLAEVNGWRTCVVRSL